MTLRTSEKGAERIGVRYLDLVDEITAPLPPMPVVRLRPPVLAPLTRPLGDATVLIVNSAGVHLRADPPFEFVDDLRCRRIPQSTDPAALRPCHPSPIRRPGRQDVNVVHPYLRLAELAAEGVIGRTSDFHLSTLGAIKQVSRIVTELGPAVAAEAKAAGADLVLVVPLCPACHQAMGILARVVEMAGIPTVSVTGARDITERVRPPRAAYLDFPLGYCLGRPGQPDEQRQIVRDVLALAEQDIEPGGIVDLAYRWPEQGWQEAIAAQYRDERDIVRQQRAKEFVPAATFADDSGGVDAVKLGHHAALDEVRAVEQMAAAGLL